MLSKAAFSAIAANWRFVRKADLRRQKMLREARTTASVKLPQGVVNQSQRRQWAESGRAPGRARESWHGPRGC